MDNRKAPLFRICSASCAAKLPCSGMTAAQKNSVSHRDEVCFRGTTLIPVLRQALGVRNVHIRQLLPDKISRGIHSPPRGSPRSELRLRCEIRSPSEPGRASSRRPALSAGKQFSTLHLHCLCLFKPRNIVAISPDSVKHFSARLWCLPRGSSARLTGTALRISRSLRPLLRTAERDWRPRPHSHGRRNISGCAR